MSLHAIENTPSFPPSGDLPGEIPADAVCHALVRRGLALWRELRGQRLFPSRSQTSPRALGPLLRNTVFVKVLGGGEEFQIRVMGDVITAAQDFPLQGLTTAAIDLVLPGYGRTLHGLYSRACTTRAPVALRGPLVRKSRLGQVCREYLLLPLGETDAAVDHLLSLIVYLSPSENV